MDIKNDINTEHAILEAAEALFLEKGFALTSTTEIAKKVGCNQAMVHYYFRTKDRLFTAIFEKKIRLFISIIHQIESEPLGFEEKLKRKIEAHFEILRANPKLPFLIINEFNTNPQSILILKERLQELPLQIIQNIEKELHDEIQKGNIRNISFFDLIITMVSLNITLFLASPVITAIGNMSTAEFDVFLNHRKQENVRIILSSLKP